MGKLVLGVSIERKRPSEVRSVKLEVTNSKVGKSKVAKSIAVKSRSAEAERQQNWGSTLRRLDAKP